MLGDLRRALLDLTCRDRAQGSDDQTTTPTAYNPRGRLIKQSQDPPLPLPREAPKIGVR